MIGVNKSTRHPKYNGLSNDIAVLELAEKLQFGPGIAAIRLASKEDVAKAGDNATISGWGLLHQDDSWIPKHLQVAHVPIVDRQKCKEAYNHTKWKVDETMICTNLPEGGKNPCNVSDIRIMPATCTAHKYVQYSYFKRLSSH